MKVTGPCSFIRTHTLCLCLSVSLPPSSSPGEVRSLWAQLRRDEPHLLSNFEEFLARVTYQIKEAKEERREMESALQRSETTNTSSVVSATPWASLPDTD